MKKLGNQLCEQVRETIKESTIPVYLGRVREVAAEYGENVPDTGVRLAFAKPRYMTGAILQR